MKASEITVAVIIILFVNPSYTGSLCTAEQELPAVRTVPDQYKTIHEAMQAAQYGDTVFIKAGVYVQNKIILKNGVKLIGEGMEKVTLKCDIQKGRNSCVIAADNPTGVIKDLTVEHIGTNTTENREVGIYLVNSAVEVINCRVRKSVGHGIAVKNSKSKITNCILEDNGFAGICVFDKESYPEIRGCRIVNNEQDGILFRSAAGGTVVDNTIEQNMYNGIEVNLTQMTIIKDNRCHANSGDGISVVKSKKLEIEGNTCTDNKMSGISITETEEINVLKGNTCSGNWNNGILVAAGTLARAESNICMNNSKNGIYVSGRGARAILKNNKCQSNGERGICFAHRATGEALDNICSENIADGIFVTDRYVTTLLKGNQCIANKANGILFDNAADGIVENNTCKDNLQHGIAVLSNLSSPELKNNIITNNQGEKVFYEMDEYADARQLLQEENFDQLEMIVSKYRNQKTRTKGGNWQLNFFYDYLSRNWNNSEYAIGILDKWIKEKPMSVTPRILMAKIYTLRYDGRKAWKILTEAEKLEANDPELYSSLIEAARWSDKPISEVDMLFEKGRAIEPTYFPLYFEKAEYIKAKQSIPELIDFMDKTIELTKQEEEYSYYARIASHVLNYYKRKEFKELGLSYEKMKKGFNNIIDRFPETSYYYSRFCLIASIYEDKETARKLFDVIGNDLNRSAWGGEDVFNWYRRWAYEKDSEPKKLKTVDKPNYLYAVVYSALLLLIGLSILVIITKKLLKS